MYFTSDSLLQDATFPDDPSAGPVPADIHSGNINRPAEFPAGGDSDTYEMPGMPPLADHTLTDTHSCARLLAIFSGRLVVAHTPGTDLPSSLYVVDPATGLVSSNRAQILALSMQMADRLMSRYDDLTAQVRPAEGQGPDSGGPRHLPTRGAVINHTGALRSARAPERHQNVVGGVLEHDLHLGGPLASRLTVRPHASLDADMSVIGTPKGVLDVRTLRILPPTEARARFISRNTGVEYHENARDPRVDQILPSPSAVDHQSRVAFIMRWIGWHITHPPRRDLLGLISERNSGKSTLVSTILAGLGDYVHVIRAEALAGGRASSNPGAHNDELMLFGGGRLMVFVMEARRHSRELLNLVTGGDRVATRPIRRAAVQVTVTAGLAIVGNTPGAEQSTGAVLDIGGDDEVSTALRDRVRIVRLPRRGQGEGSPPDLLDLAVAALTSNWTAEFRQAALGRILEWAVVMVDRQDPPEPTAEMVGDQAVQEAAERPRWQSEFVPHILTTDTERAILEHIGAGQSIPRAADSYSVYHEYLRWHEEIGGTGSVASRRAVTDALLSHYSGLKDVAREGRIGAPGGGRRTKTLRFDGYYICDLNVDGYSYST